MKNRFITPLKNPARRAGNRKPEALVALVPPALRDGFLRGVWKEIAKKVHNGSENSENKKKYGVAEIRQKVPLFGTKRYRP